MDVWKAPSLKIAFFSTLLFSVSFLTAYAWNSLIQNEIDKYKRDYQSIAYIIYAFSATLFLFLYIWFLRYLKK